MNHIRQGQNNNNSKRSRGRGRKPQSSGNRAYDSNGPDVKIRGTATHVCEKYQQLARDAITSGDRVMAENYYQHAEHYYRLIMASQTPNDGQPRPQNALGYRPDEDQDEDEDDFSADQPQPNFPNQPYHQQQQQYERQPRNNNNGNGNGGGRSYQDRNQNSHQEHAAAPAPEPVEAAAETVAEGSEQPVITGEAQAAAAPGEGVRRRPGRRRRPRHEAGAAIGGEGGEQAAGDTAPAASDSDEVSAS